MATVSPPDLEAMLASPDPHVRFEVVDGHIVEKPPMGAFEYDLAHWISFELSTFAIPLGLGRSFGEMIFDLRPAVDCQRRPDAAYISADRWPLHARAPRTAAWAIIPDLAIEVVSPTNTATEVLTKVDEYFRAGVKLVWVVYPTLSQIYAYESTTSLRVFGPGMELDGGTVIPGFRLSISGLFGEPPALP